MEERTSISQASTATHIIESVLGSLEPEGSDRAFVPLKAGEEDIGGNRGLEVEDSGQGKQQGR